MSEAKPFVIRWLPEVADGTIALVSLACVLLFVNATELPNGIQQFLGLRITVKNLLLLTTLVVLWNGAFRAAGAYQMHPMRPFRETAWRVVAACAVGSMVAFLLQLANSATIFTVQAAGYFWILTTALCIFYRTAGALIRDFISVRNLDRRYVLIVGTGELAGSWARDLVQCHAGTEIIGFVRCDIEGRVCKAAEGRVLGELPNLSAILMSRIVDQVIITLPAESCYPQIQEAIRVCERVGVDVSYQTVLFEHTVGRVEYDQTYEKAVLSVKHTGHEHLLAVKRSLDILASFTGLVVLSPVLLAVAIAVKVTSEGPIVFSQERFGRNKRRFKMFKFRTMVVNAEALQQALEAKNEATGPVFKIKDDPRITPVGKFLRKTSLDELPQLFNVLVGDMSLVGPRPLPVRDVSRFSDPWLMRRFSVKPGLTCLWQVNGRSNTNFDKWIALDLEYIDQWSLTLDLVILAKTVPVVLRGTGAA